MQAKLLALVMLLAACGRPAPAPAPAPHPTPFPPTPVSLADMDTETLLGRLTARDKIAQLVMPWIPGTFAAYDDEALGRMQAWVDELHVGGLIVSVGSPLDIAAKLNHLQRRSGLPLLIGSDFEGGTSIRFTGGTPLPPNMGVGATGSDSAAYETGRITAREGRAVGIHLAFAPVADVNNNPDNPIINVRSFGEDPAAVARLVAAEVRGLQDHGMLATAKHFPGHGDTGTDSHLELPVITADWRRLDSVELVPFRAAIGAGVEVVMSAHIALPGIDPGELRPGTIAPNVLTGVLRDSLGFRGLIVTDALNMAGVAREYGAAAAVRAFVAGADLLLQPGDPRAAIEAMAAALEGGEFTEERLDHSVRRVLEAKRALGLLERRTVRLDSIPAVVGSAAFLATARDIATRSVVMVKDVGGTVHGLRRAPRGLALVSYAEEDNRAAGTVLAGELRARGLSVSAFRLWPASGPASYDSAAALLARSPTALFAVADRPTAGRGTIGAPQALLELLRRTALTRPTILVSLGNPYLISRVPEVGSYLIAWRSNPVAEEAAARALAGTAPITGRLPISIPPLYPRGWGVMRRVP